MSSKLDKIITKLAMFGRFLVIFSLYLSVYIVLNVCK